MKLLTENELRFVKHIVADRLKVQFVSVAPGPSVKVIYSSVIKSVGDQRRLTLESRLMSAMHRGDITHIEYKQFQRFVDSYLVVMIVPEEKRRPWPPWPQYRKIDVFGHDCFKHRCCGEPLGERRDEKSIHNMESK